MTTPAEIRTVELLEMVDEAYDDGWRDGVAWATAHLVAGYDDDGPRGWRWWLVVALSCVVAPVVGLAVAWSLLTLMAAGWLPWP